MSPRWLSTPVIVLPIAALTFFVSRKLGFAMLLLPPVLAWGGRSRS